MAETSAPATGVTPLTAAELAATRANLLAAAVDVPVAPGTRIDELTIGGRPGLRVRPAGGGSAGVALLLHGGGYRAGTPAGARGIASYIAAGADVELLLPDYRLAPEHPLPAAVDDVVGALRELAERGVDPARTALIGSSAGGGLAVAALLAARDAGLPRPGGLVALSPWLDMTASSPSYDRCAASDPIISRTSSLRSALAYLGGADPRTPLASPLFADDEALAWLPPSLVQVSAAEVLSDEARRFAERVWEAGGSCRLETWPDTTHCWHLGVPDLPAATDAIGRIVEYLEIRFE